MLRLNFIGSFTAQGKIKKSFRKAKQTYLNRIRLAVSSFYFAMGLCFATWASRIPDIKMTLALSDADLGSILFALPVGQLVMMPFSGKLVTRYGSHRLVVFSVIMYGICLSNLGLATTAWQLAIGLFLFGMFGNMNNIAVNTQGVYTEKLFNKTIMASFHGVWSFAGFTGALIGLAMLKLELTPHEHFLIVAAIVLALVLFNFKFLIKAKEIPKLTQKKPLFSKPDAALLWLGVIGFGCMASEGIMFDWSGVYFKDVVKAPGELIVLGYISFMIIPTLYSLAGKHPTIPPGEALTAVSSVSFLGFLMGPPVIGYIAELFGLRFSFAFIGVFGLVIALLVARIKAFR